MVGLRDFTQSRKLRRCSGESYNLTLQRFSGIDSILIQSSFEASKPLRSTQTQPSVPIHFVPITIDGCPPATVIETSFAYPVTSFLYLHSTRYFVHVFQSAFAAGNSPIPSTSDGP